MRVRDPLYGEFFLPSLAADLIMAPGVRRLSSVRLLNYASPSLATLGELRRYSHTLGVIRLAMENAFLGVREADFKALIAALILHDIGTPPFGHLFEYRLKERFGWSHEGVIADVLAGAHVAETSAHYMASGGVTSLISVLKRHQVPMPVLRAILSKEHALAQFVFGTLDFDNLDNVARMNWALGLPADIGAVLRLAKALSLNGTELELPRAETTSVQAWAAMRRAAYEVLAFDEHTVAGQAVLTKALDAALDAQELALDDWTLLDEELIRLLASCRSSKSIVQKDLLGGLPQLALLIRDATPLAHRLAASASRLAALVEEYLCASFEGRRSYGYAFADSGAFSKALHFRDPASGEMWSSGERSQSVVLYGFVKAPHPLRLDVEEEGRRFEQWAQTRASAVAQ